MVLNNQSISLEPAGQFELSGASLDNIHQTCDEITNHLNQMKQLSLKHNFILLGIGVDSGIHITERFYEEKNTQTNIYMTSSIRGVIVSTLTTVFSIGNLIFSSHQGTASMGLLLSLGLISMMIATMIILPSFLIWRNSLKIN